MFYDILEQKNVFLGYENMKVKKSKNRDGFGQKGAIFSFFFLGNIGQENVLWYSRTKKRVSRLWKQEV